MNIDRIIGRFLLGQQSQDELHTLEEWKSDAEENLKELQAIQKLWNDSQGLQDYQDFDADSALAKLELSLESSSPTGPANAKIMNFSYVKWISGLAACFLMVFAGYQYMASQETSVIADTKNIVYSLQDGSAIELAEGAKLVISDDQEKNLELDGRAYFEIAKQEDTRLTIDTRFGDIEVIGTAFVVEAAQDYTSVSVVEGTVRLKTSNKEQILTEGMTAMTNGKSLNVKRIDTYNYKSLITGDLQYEGVPLYQVVNDLNRHFGNKLLLGESNSKFECKVSSVFSDLSLEDILKELSLTIGLKFHKKENKYVIDSVSC